MASAIASLLSGDRPRGSHVDRLLEKWADERIGLVEDSQDAQAPSIEQALDRILDAVHVPLDSDFRGGRVAQRLNEPILEKRGDTTKRALKLLRIVGANHAAARGE